MENWVSITGYEGAYEVSDYGRIRSVAGLVANGSGFRLRPSKMLSAFRNECGYRIVCLSKQNRIRPFRVSRLVAIHFIPNPLNLPEVNHKWGDKDDNRATSLEWSSISYNRAHAWRMGLNKGNSKVSK